MVINATSENISEHFDFEHCKDLKFENFGKYKLKMISP